jgi:hypothetical protein
MGRSAKTISYEKLDKSEKYVGNIDFIMKYFFSPLGPTTKERMVVLGACLKPGIWKVIRSFIQDLDIAFLDDIFKIDKHEELIAVVICRNITVPEYETVVYSYINNKIKKLDFTQMEKRQRLTYVLPLLAMKADFPKIQKALCLKRSEITAELNRYAAENIPPYESLSGNSDS